MYGLASFDKILFSCIIHIMYSAFRHDGDTLSYTASRKLSAGQRDTLKREIIGLHADTVNNTLHPVPYAS